jgi:hypothetical protein
MNREHKAETHLNKHPAGHAGIHEGAEPNSAAASPRQKARDTRRPVDLKDETYAYIRAYN